MFSKLCDISLAVAPPSDFWSLRVVDDTGESLLMRKNILEFATTQRDLGVMISVYDKGGAGYHATSNLCEQGIKEAFSKACAWASFSAKSLIFDPLKLDSYQNLGSYESGRKISWQELSLKEKIDFLTKANENLAKPEEIIDWQASLTNHDVKTLLFTSTGTKIEQNFSYLSPDMSATANAGTNTQIRSLYGRGLSRQSGLELLKEFGLVETANQIADEAVQLLHAPNCPSGVMDLMLAPDQMLLQIHESIGHPLELDRILGDERNYAGTTFVTMDMFGKYAYGSKLLNVTFDPSLPGEFASYGYDDDGSIAKKTFIIKEGILKRPLGGGVSQARAGIDGIANSRACSWNRPPIDRIANLNLEPGESSFETMVSCVERGIFMKSNTSWSIDDSRNKFQFGCEWGQLIENGELTKVVRNPNYRGISSNFWQNLSAVGNEQTFKIFGLPNCGKGEPNQCIRVGHASPTCLFTNVSVFGGER